MLISLNRHLLIGECMGRNIANRLLVELAVLVRCRIRREDLLARVGPGEFGVVCRDTTAAAAHALAERLREMARTHRVEWRGEKVAFQVSVSVAPTQDAGTASPRQLLEQARASWHVAVAQSDSADSGKPDAGQ